MELDERELVVGSKREKDENIFEIFVGLVFGFKNSCEGNNCKFWFISKKN